MTLLAMLRHAETPWSRDKRIQGRTDIELSDAGRDAIARRRLPAQCDGFRVLTSPLRRCVETAALIGHAHAPREPRLAEMHWGRWEGRRIEDLRAEFGPAMHDNEAQGLDFRPDGGESPRELWSRVAPWLHEVANAGQPTVAVTHRGVIRVVFARAMDWDLRGRPPLKLDWHAVHLFELDPRGEPRLVHANLPLVPCPPGTGAR